MRQAASLDLLTVGRVRPEPPPARTRPVESRESRFADDLAAASLDRREAAAQSRKLGKRRDADAPAGDTPAEKQAPATDSPTQPLTTDDGREAANDTTQPPVVVAEVRPVESDQTFTQAGPAVQVESPLADGTQLGARQRLNPIPVTPQKPAIESEVTKGPAVSTPPVSREAPTTFTPAVDTIPAPVQPASNNAASSTDGETVVVSTVVDGQPAEADDGRVDRSATARARAATDRPAASDKPKPPADNHTTGLLREARELAQSPRLQEELAQDPRVAKLVKPAKQPGGEAPATREQVGGRIAGENQPAVGSARALAGTKSVIALNTNDGLPDADGSRRDQATTPTALAGVTARAAEAQPAGQNVAHQIGNWLFAGHDAPSLRSASPGQASAAEGQPVIASLAAGAETDTTSALDRIAQAVGGSGGKGPWRVSLRVDPPELGTIFINAHMNQGALNLQIRADHEAVGRMVEARIGELRDALSDHGIRMDRAEITVRGGEGSASYAGGQDSPGGSPLRWHDSSSGGQRDAGEGSRSDDHRSGGEGRTASSQHDSGGRESTPSRHSAAEATVDLVA